jgi:hypothetical protein
MLRVVAGAQFEVFVVSLETAEAEVAELRLGGNRFGHKLLLDGRAVLRIEPPADGQRGRSAHTICGAPSPAPPSCSKLAEL